MRILALCSAVLLVGAFALANLAPSDLDLGTALLKTDHAHMLVWQTHLEHWSPWAWRELATPLLVRPAWFLLVVLGVLCGGLALSVSGREASRPRRQG